MGAQDITWLSLGLCFALLVIPLAIFLLLKVKLIKVTAWSVFRMSVQLLLVGLFLTYLFEWDIPLVTLAWLLVMITFAAFSVVGSTRLSYKRYILPVLLSFLVAAFLARVCLGRALHMSRLLQTPVEAVDASFRVNNALFAREKRMAG